MAQRLPCFGFGGLGRKPAIFPAKFPVCRELVWRQVRSELRRQPGSSAFGRSAHSAWPTPRAKSAKVSSPLCEYSHFAETFAGDFGSIAAGRRGQVCRRAGAMGQRINWPATCIQRFILFSNSFPVTPLSRTCLQRSTGSSKDAFADEVIE